MVIKSINTKIISVPFSDPPKTGFLTLDKIDLLIVRVETKDGVIGTGHLHPLTGGLKTIEMCIHEMLKPLLLGESINNIELLWGIGGINKSNSSSWILKNWKGK